MLSVFEEGRKPAPAAVGRLTSDSERKCFSGACVPGGHGNFEALSVPPRGRVGIVVHSAKVLLLRFQWVPVHSLLPLPQPHLLLYWNRFIQCGNFVTFLIEGNFLFQHFRSKVFAFFFFLPQEGGITTLHCFSLFSFHFINKGEGVLVLAPLYLLDFR